jgi:hypothetical protein
MEATPGEFVVRNWDENYGDVMDALVGLIALSKGLFPKSFAPIALQHTETILDNAGRNTRDTRLDNTSALWAIAQYITKKR